MALSRTEINARSDAKRGIVTKAFKIPNAVSVEIDRLSVELGISKGKVIQRAVALLAESSKGT